MIRLLQTGVPTVGRGVSTMGEANGALTQSSSARVLWAVAVLDTPTAAEIQDCLDIEQKPSTSLLRLYRSGLVARRKRDTNTKGTPYEYAIRIPEET